MDIRVPIFQWGEKVLAAVDLVNDGSFPGAAEGAVLAAEGTQGEVVNVGHHSDTNLPVYLIEFPSGTVIGCFEHELERPGEAKASEEA